MAVHTISLMDLEVALTPQPHFLAVFGKAEWVALNPLTRAPSSSFDDSQILYNDNISHNYIFCNHECSPSFFRSSSSFLL
jgi:hypothetical protein